jgi:formate-dependent nitrite reductase membrane component NrfD
MYPFGLQIVAYLFLAGTAAGMALFGTFAVSSNDATEARGGRRSIAWAAACSAAGALFLIGDLERPGDFGLILLTANPVSAIAWGARILVVFILSAFAVSLLGGGRARLDSAMVWTLRGAAVGVAIYPAFVLRQAHAFPLWQGPLLVPLIVVSSLHAGACAATVIGVARDAAGNMRSAERVLGSLQLLLALLFVLGAGATAATERPTAFWLVFLVLGTVLPLYLVVKKPASIEVGRCLLVVLGALALRFWLVAAGQGIHSL